jgi:hypothetical protein
LVYTEVFWHCIALHQNIFIADLGPIFHFL